MKKRLSVLMIALLVVVNGCKPSENADAEQPVASESALTETAQGMEQVPADMRLVDKLVQEYYLQPKAESVTKIMQLLDSLIAQQGQAALEGMSAPVLGFFSQVFKDNPKQLEKWQKTLFALSSRELKLVLLNALCFAGSSEARSILSSHCDDFPELRNIQFNEEPPNLLDLPLEAPQLLDMTWGAFFATGNLAFAKRILDVACTSETGKDVNLTIRTALWSMVTNASRHTKLRKFLNESLLSSTNETLRTFVKPLTAEHRKAIFDDALLLKANILQVPPKAEEKTPQGETTSEAKN